MRLTKELTQYCHEMGIVMEVECGRIEGGEDEVGDTVDLEGLMTSPEQAKEFVDTDMDWLASAFGTVHGLHGPKGIQLDFERLDNTRKTIGSGVHLMLHRTDGFDEKIHKECIARRTVKCSTNRVVNQRLTKPWRESQSRMTGVMEEGAKAMQEEIDILIDWLGSAGKAS